MFVKRFLTVVLLGVSIAHNVHVMEKECELKQIMEALPPQEHILCFVDCPTFSLFAQTSKWSQKMCDSIHPLYLSFDFHDAVKCCNKRLIRRFIEQVALFDSGSCEEYSSILIEEQDEHKLKVFFKQEFSEKFKVYVSSNFVNPRFAYITQKEKIARYLFSWSGGCTDNKVFKGAIYLNVDECADLIVNLTHKWFIHCGSRESSYKSLNKLGDWRCCLSWSSWDTASYNNLEGSENIDPVENPLKLLGKLVLFRRAMEQENKIVIRAILESPSTFELLKHVFLSHKWDSEFCSPELKNFIDKVCMEKIQNNIRTVLILKSAIDSSDAEKC